MKNPNFEPRQPNDSLFWRSRIASFINPRTLARDTERPFSRTLSRCAPPNVASYDVVSDTDSGIVTMNFNMFGQDRQYVRIVTVGLSMLALEKSGINPVQAVFIEGNIVNNQAFIEDRDTSDGPVSLRDARYQDNDGLMHEHMQFKSLKTVVTE